MKSIVLVLFFSLFAIGSFSQEMYGFKGGLGRTTSFKSYLTPVLEAYLLTKVSRSVHLGGAISHERYSFLYQSNIAPGLVKFGDVISIRQKSSYLYFSPKADFGLGYHKYVHLNLSLSGGILMGGSQWTNKHEPYWNIPGGGTYGVDTGMHNTSYNSPALRLRIGLGFSERLPVHGFWNIILYQDFGYLPKGFYNGAPDIRTHYFSLSVGIMHNTDRVLVEY